MTERLRDWLPTEAAEQLGVRGRIEGVVAEWSAHWFASGTLGLSAWGLGQDAVVPGDATWRDCGGSLQASCSARAGLRLACMALGARSEHVDLNDRDRSLLSALSRRMIDDLAERLRRLLGLSGVAIAPPASKPRFIAKVSDGCDTLVAIAIPFALLIKLCRQALPRARPPATALQSRREAVTPTGIRLEATLGSALLGLADVRDLAVGDLLVLDRTVDDTVELSVAGVPVGQGVLTEIDGQAALILQRIP
jgi:flagellar motor switch/type III secretory pathway protein FliN